MAKGRPSNQVRADKLALREACQAFESVYNKLETLMNDYTQDELKSNITQISFYLGKMGTLYQRIVEKGHIFEEEIEE